ncbi:hypothetical protein BJV78DRAFT_116524 [Lactifluus subvellereus]|nr:hypothetical protein BJV78DRAFT_116524 [Lactifluus subvellereus]
MTSIPSWKKSFNKGIAKFRHQDLDGALKSFNEAIRFAGDTSYTLYDSRASVYERLNRPKDALHDAKKTIDIAPAQWHGYFRSARLFAALNKSDAALQMCSLALERLGTDAKYEARRRELLALRSQLEAQAKCPIAGIPVELLLMVFELAGRPVLLSHVCRRWREVTLSQPALWRSLVLTGQPKKALRKAREWGKRSCGRIAELTVRKSLGEIILPQDRQRAVHPDDIATRDNILAELQLLDLARVKAFHLESVDVAHFLAALESDTSDVDSHTLNCLETLSISQTSSNGPFFFGSKAYAIRSWESLRALSISNMGCNWMALTVLLHDLTSFEYRTSDFPVDFQSIRRLLQANDKMEKLVIEAENVYLFARPVEVPKMLTSAHLRHLELDGVNLSRHSTLNLSLPSLQILRLSRLPGTVTVLQNLVEDLGTSFAGLIELTMRGCSLQASSLTLALTQAPKLEVLQLTSDFDVNAVAESLSRPCTVALPVPTSRSIEPIPTELPILCPALSVLDLSGSPSLKTGPLMRIVKERIALAASEDGGRYRLPGQDDEQRVSYIQVLKVDGCPDIEAEILPWFRKNVPTFSCRYIVAKESRRMPMG